jgi:hypothetical protein
MIFQKYNKYFLVVLILILLYNLFLNYKNNIIEGLVDSAKDCFNESILKNCMAPKNNKNEACQPIEKDSDGKYYQVCPSDNIDNECSKFCPSNWRFNVDSNGIVVPNSEPTPEANNKYYSEYKNKQANNHSNDSVKEHIKKHIDVRVNEIDEGNEKEDINKQIISINFNSGSDHSLYPLLSSNNLLYNQLPFTSQSQCLSSATGAFTDCGPVPYNSRDNNSRDNKSNDMIEKIAAEFLKISKLGKHHLQSTHNKDYHNQNEFDDHKSNSNSISNSNIPIHTHTP